MKKTTKIFIVIGIIIAILVIIAVYLFMNDAIQKAKIIEEFSKIEEISSEEINIEALNEKTNNLVTTGEYAKVEKAAKNYILDLYNEINSLNTLIQDEKITNVLTADNYRNDGPDFISTKEFLNTKRTEIENEKNIILEFLQEEKINSYIEEQNTSSYFQNVYKTTLNTKEILNLNEEKNELEESVGDMIDLLNKQEAVIDYLIQNKGQWQVQGEQVLFNTNTQVQEYTNLLNEISQ